MKEALRRAGMDDPTWMKYHFSTGLNYDIAKKTSLHDYTSLDDLYIGALKAEQELMKAKASPSQAHFATTKLHDDEHEDSTTMMSKLDELQDDAPKFDFTAIPLCGIDDAEPTMTLFEDGAATTTTMDPPKDQDLEVSDMVASKDDASIIGGESEMTEHGIFPLVMEAGDDVPSSAFIHGHGHGDEIVEHGIFLSTTTVYGDELRNLCTHSERVREFTTSLIYDEMPQFPCEESHPHHHMSVMSDSTICEFECIHLEGVSEPPHRESEVVDRSCEAIFHSNNLTSTSIVSSPLVQGPIYDDAPILDDFVQPLDMTMAMVDYDAPPTWFHQEDDLDHELVFATSPTPLVWNNKGPHTYLSTSQAHELTKRALESNEDVRHHGVLTLHPPSSRRDFAHLFYMALTWLWVIALYIFLCPSCHVHFACYDHSYAFAMHL